MTDNTVKEWDSTLIDADGHVTMAWHHHSPFPFDGSKQVTVDPKEPKTVKIDLTYFAAAHGDWVAVGTTQPEFNEFRKYHVTGYHLTVSTFYKSTVMTVQTKESAEPFVVNVNYPDALSLCTLLDEHIGKGAGVLFRPYSSAFTLCNGCDDLDALPQGQQQQQKQQPTR